MVAVPVASAGSLTTPGPRVGESLVDREAVSTAGQQRSEAATPRVGERLVEREAVSTAGQQRSEAATPRVGERLIDREAVSTAGGRPTEVELPAMVIRGQVLNEKYGLGSAKTDRNVRGFGRDNAQIAAFAGGLLVVAASLGFAVLRSRPRAATHS